GGTRERRSLSENSAKAKEPRSASVALSFRGGRGETWTRTGFPIRPSNVRVYQFHHPGPASLLMPITSRPSAAPGSEPERPVPERSERARSRRWVAAELHPALRPVEARSESRVALLPASGFVPGHGCPTT